ncbi:MAG: hypothetical protein R3E68_23105 [Burkholderiaceae bacterium]
MAARGLTGPQNFLAGHYGYAHLYGRGTLEPAQVVSHLGGDWHLDRVVFKKYPSCGVTQGVTELALGLVADLQLTAGSVRRAQVRLPPYAHRLVGHPFQVGANPRVDAQFSAAYCVANALVRRSSTLAHFAPAQVLDPQLRDILSRIDVVADSALDARGHTAVDLVLVLDDGREHRRALDTAPGFPGAALSDAQHLARFDDCLAYAPRAPSPAQRERLLGTLGDLAAMSDARDLAGLLTVG